MASEGGTGRDGSELAPLVRELLAFLGTKQLVSSTEAIRIWRAAPESPSTAETAIQAMVDAGAITAVQGDMVRRTFVREQRARVVSILEAAGPRGLVAPDDVARIPEEFEPHALVDTPDAFLITRGVLTGAQIESLRGDGAPSPTGAATVTSGFVVEVASGPQPKPDEAGDWMTHVPVLRALRPFRRRAALWAEASRKGTGKDPEFDARRRAIEDELAGAPSLLADLVGAFITAIGLVTVLANLGDHDAPLAMGAMVVVSVTWLLPGHHWIFAVARAAAAIASTALVVVATQPSADDDLLDLSSVVPGGPPSGAFPLPLGQPVLAVGLCLVALGVRSLARRAPALSVPTISLALISLVGVTAVGAIDYGRAVDARMERHRAFASAIVNTRNAPEEDLSIVRAAVASGSSHSAASDSLRRLELAFPGSSTVGVLRASFNEVAAADTRRQEDERLRQQEQDAARHRAERAQADREEAIYTRCLLVCLSPLNDCLHNSSFSEEFCRANFKNNVECDEQCGGIPMLRGRP